MNTPRIVSLALLALPAYALHAEPAPAGPLDPEPSGDADVAAAGTRPLLRFPDVHGDTVVFAHGEDLWRAPLAGGAAVRLTLHDGQERFPKFSPDGKRIAFTGDYDGNTDVFVMDADGGDITRVTYHPGADVVVGWHPLEQKILFRSARNSFSRFERLFLVAPDGTGPEELILHEAAAGSFAPDGTRIAYNRVAREHRTWKRYQGGLAQDLYLFDFSTGEDRRLTTFAGTDRTPMWHGDKVYFTSDRDRTLNVFAYDLATGKVARLTDHDRHDVRRPSLGDGGRIAYELGGELWLLDVASGRTGRIPIEIRADAPEARPYWKDVADEVTSIAPSPSGQRTLVVARGELFSVPREKGPTRNLTRSSGARDKDAAWSPDGKWIAYLSDQSGEYAIHLIDPLGQAEPRQLTTHADGYRHTLRWSPDSTKLAFADQTLRCWIVDVASGALTEVDRSSTEPVDVGLDEKPIHDHAWSPDSRYLAYSKIDADQVSKVYVYSLADGQRHLASGGLFNDFGPVFARDGRHLFFISNRRFDPTLCDFEWELVYKRVAGIYALTLAADGDALLPPESDEEVASSEAAEKDAEEDAGAVTVRIDVEGLAERLEALPLPRGNYRSLAAGAQHLFFLDAEEGDFNRFEYRAKGPRELRAFDFEAREARTLVDAVDAYALSADGSHIAYRRGSTLGTLATAGGEPKSLDGSGLRMWLDPRAEWAQIFAEAWRLERDFFYEPGMHGLDWGDVRAKYGALIPSASCRQDVQYLIGEMIGELATSHTYVFGGDRRRTPERVGVGLLGADWELDAEHGRYRVTRIYGTPDWTLGTYPPLARPGVRVRAGDYLMSVDSRDVTTERNLYSYFEGKAGQQVRVAFSAQPDGERREYVVEPLGSERTLRYRAWVEHNRRVVDEASDGRIGYLHLPDTYLGSAREFPKYFYSQTQKQGLVVDGRFNGGGLDPDIFLQRLAKQPLGYWTRRYSMDQVNPPVLTTAHMVCLTNRQAGSGGDMLPMEFRQKGLGPVIGTRTWGGLVGVSMFLELIDGGGLTAPDYRIYSPDGRWVVENEGVAPDIEVDLTPTEMARGHDAQLQKGIEVLLEKIASEPRTKPQHPPFPVDR